MNFSDQLVPTCKNLLSNLYGNELVSDIYRHFEGSWSGRSRKFADFSPIFSHARGVFRTVSAIKDGASCENSQRFSSKMEPFGETIFAKYCILDVWQGSECAFYSKSIYENSNARILVYFKGWVFLTHFKPLFHS